MALLEVVRGVERDDAVPGLLARAGATGRTGLAVWIDQDPAMLLGRFHVRRDSAPPRRRLTGGRVVPTGPDRVRMALALPHRSAIESDHPSALRPEQAMNRCVRGLLDACRALGADAFYPGRDVVTVAGVPVAWLALTEKDDGVALFEASLALPERSVPTIDAAEAVLAAYRGRGWESVVDVSRAQLPETEPPDLEWPVPPEADRAGEVQTMLGSLGAHVRVDDGRRLTAVRISGDVIAPVATICAIERALLHLPALRGELERAVGEVLADERRWVLGIDGPRDVAGAVMAALA